MVFIIIPIPILILIIIIILFFEKITNLVPYSHIFCNGYFHLKRNFRYIFAFVITQKQTTLAKKASQYERTKAKTANCLVLLLLRL